MYITNYQNINKLIIDKCVEKFNDDITLDTGVIDININIDLNDLEKLKDLIKNINPDIIINCVGNTNVDFCEKNKKIAFNDNALTVKNLVYCLQFLKTKPHLIHISTDQVYNGVFKGNPSRENEICAKNIYGISKLKGELELKNYKKKTILRTNFFGK